MIRREAYQRLGPYDNRLRHLPDFDMWIRLVKQYQLVILDRELIRFRVVPGENASDHSWTNHIRALNEHYFIARTFFDGVSAELLREGFSDLLTKKELLSDQHLGIEKALLLLTDVPTLGAMYKMLALTRLHDMLAMSPHREALINDYGFDDRVLQGLAAEVAVFKPDALIAAPAKLLAEELRRRLLGRVRRSARQFLQRPKFRQSVTP